MTKLITLSGKYGTGKFAIVDDCDYDRLKKYSWHCTPSGYASGGSKATSELGHHFMHRVICSPPNGMHPDHINGNTLDNRSENLRPVTPSQNMMNTRIRKNKISKYKGVWWNDIVKFWYAAISQDGKTTYLGNFDTQKEAAIVYNKAAIERFGKYAKINEIPDIDTTDAPVVKIRPRRGGISQFVGVTNKGGEWEAYIRRDGGGKHNLGTYPSEKFAAMVFDSAAIQRYGTDAIRHVNFPNLINSPLDLRNRFIFKATPKGANIFAGVRRNKDYGQWHTRYTIAGKRHFWNFASAEQAAEHYDKNVLMYDTHNAIYLNFPDKVERYLTELDPLPTPVQVAEEI